MSVPLEKPVLPANIDGRQAIDRRVMALLRGEIDPRELLDAARASILNFERWTPPASDAALLVAALAAVRPDSITPELGEAVGVVIARADLSQTWQPEVDEAISLLNLLVPSLAWQTVRRIVIQMLETAALHPRWFRRAARLLADLNDLQPGSLDVAALLDVVQRRARDERDVLLRSVVARLILAEPRITTVATLRRFAALQSEPSQARYLFAALASHAAVPPDVRSFARNESAEWFPLRGPWRRMLRTSSPRILCVQNIADGQGDEIIRVVPLLQAFLDEFLASPVTLITDRGYLYGHSRIEVVSFDEPDRVAAALHQHHDILIEFSDRRQRHLNHDPGLIEEIDNVRSSRPSVIDVTAAKGWNRFTFDRVVIGGMDWATALGLHHSLEPNVYDPVFRLIAELGLPLRVGEQPLFGEPVLARGPSSRGDEAWSQAILNNADRRPVALLNPFGGSASLKGFTARKFGDLATLIEQLADEGYYVLVCPNGQPWGSFDAIRELLCRLPDEVRRHIGNVPESWLSAAAENCRDDEGRPNTAGEFIQLLVAFVERADLVVTVEGWMMHVAYLIGRPYRLLTLPASEPDSWQPWGHSANQRWWVFPGHPTLDRVPLPEQPRKRAWLELLRRVDRREWLRELEQFAGSEDPEIREAAVQAIGRIGDTGCRAWLVDRLNDSSRQVRRAAAAALLDHHRGAIGVTSMPDADTLEVHRLIGTNPPSWREVLAFGERALPALDAPLHGDDPVIRREAALCVERIRRAKCRPAEPGADRDRFVENQHPPSLECGRQPK